jgi:beta-glucosidase
MLPVARSGEPEWIARERALAAETARGGVDLVFLGDSITEGWRFVGLETWQRYYAGRRPLNLGISADQIQHALWRIQHGNFAAIEPRAIVVQIGTNNLLADTPSEVAGGVLEVVRTLRRLEPQAHILVMGLFPRDRDPDGELRRRVAAVNRELEARVARGRKVSYLDIGAKFLEPDGSISPEVMYDYVHLAPRGYQIWAREIEPILARWLGPASAAAR